MNPTYPSDVKPVVDLNLSIVMEITRMGNFFHLNSRYQEMVREEASEVH